MWESLKGELEVHIIGSDLTKTLERECRSNENRGSINAGVYINRALAGVRGGQKLSHVLNARSRDVRDGDAIVPEFLR